MRKITAARQRNEDPAIVDYWKSIAVADKGGLMKEQQFGDYVDWYVKTGQLKEGQIRASDIYTNRFNPYRDVAQK